MPPSDVTVSTRSSVSVSLQRGERRDVVLDAGRRLRVHDRDQAGVGMLRAGRRGGAAGRAAAPTRSSTRTTSAPHRRATSHMRSPNTPLTPTITVSPGSSRLTKHASMPGRPGAADRQRQRVRRCGRRCAGAPSSRRGSRGTRDPCARASGAPSAATASGYGFDGPGPSSRRSVIGMRRSLARPAARRRV